MSKPTHILVSINEMEAVAKGNYRGNLTDRDAAQLLEDSPKVDLSEEGVKKKAGEGAEGLKAENVWYENMYIHGYQQCAKDLLNIK